MNKISILMLALLLLLIGGVVIAQDDMMKTGVTVSGNVGFASYFFGPENSDTVIAKEQPGFVDSDDADEDDRLIIPEGIEYKQYDFDVDVRFAAKVDEWNSAFVKLETQTFHNADGTTQVLDTTVDEAFIVTEIGGWSGLSAVAPVTITFKVGYYEIAPAEKGKVTQLGLEDVVAAGFSKDAGNFDVVVGIAGIVNLKAGFDFGNDREFASENPQDTSAANRTNDVFFGADASFDVGVGTLGFAASFSDFNDGDDLADGEIGVGAQFDLAAIPGH